MEVDRAEASDPLARERGFLWSHAMQDGFDTRYSEKAGCGFGSPLPLGYVGVYLRQGWLKKDGLTGMGVVYSLWFMGIMTGGQAGPGGASPCSLDCGPALS